MVENSGGPNYKSFLWKRTDVDFFSGEDVLLIARKLIGMRLNTLIDNKLTSGIITEAEAYAGETDRASHAFGGRRTRRTETMYQQAGLAYIYLCYGIHSLLNVVTNIEGIPHAVLIRAVYPVSGLDIMERRINRRINPVKDGSGPGKVTKLMGLDCSYNATDMTVSNVLWIEDSDFRFSRRLIKSTPRIGVDYAGEDALLPYRYLVDNQMAEAEIKKAGLY